jgi:hypothetical protein
MKILIVNMETLKFNIKLNFGSINNIKQEIFTFQYN